jgi:hypothetical protein
MKKLLQGSLLLVFFLSILNPSNLRAQAYCPIKIFNNSQTIGLSVTDAIYNDFVNGNYFLTIISDNYLGCVEYYDLLVPVTKTANLTSVITPAEAMKGITFTINSMTSCIPNLPDNALQTGSVSIILRKANGDEFFRLNFLDGSAEECPYIAFPVTFGSFTATQLTNPTRYRLNWTTYTESVMGHFSIEKSVNGSTYYKIGQVAATNNPSGSSYQFFDNSPNNKNYYRIVSVDLNCYKQNTNIVWTSCSTCPTTFTPPSITPDCTSPVTTPYISGPVSICDSSRKIFKLNNIKGEAQVTWSVSPANLATLSQIGRMVTVKRTATPGQGTLTATVVKNGATTTYSKQVVFGLPTLVLTGSSTSPDPCTGYYQYTASVLMLPGTNASQYDWYEGSYYMGSGQSYTWTITSQFNYNFQVRYNGPCGQSIAYGTTPGGSYERMQSGRYVASAKPGNANITIQLFDCPVDPIPPYQDRHAANRASTIDVKIYDMYGNFKKAAKMKASDAQLTINIPGLREGIYYVHLIEPGKKPQVLKVWNGK